MSRSIRSSTKTEIFVDTSGFYALLVQADRQHLRAKEYLRQAARSRGRFVTTDYVLDESATLLKARGHAPLLRTFWESVFTSSACQVEWMSPDVFAQTQRFFLKHEDQAWSFTDCFSFCVMRARGVRDALTADVHFRQAGFNPLLLDR
jgi:predicted nucleic acid-binding protein